MTAKKTASKAKAPAKAKAPTAPDGVANMAAGAAEQNTDNVEGADPAANVDRKGKEPTHGDRLDRLEELARANGWSM